MPAWRPYDVLRLIALVIGISDVLFLGLFALDTFVPGVPLPEQLAGFAIHLLPNAALALLVLCAWRWPVAGGSTLLLASILPFVALANPVWVNIMLSTPVAAAGGLFLWSGFWRRRDGKRSPS